MSLNNFVDTRIKQAMLNINTAYLAKVLSVNGRKALVQPLTVHKSVGGKAKEQTPVSAYVPTDIKFKHRELTYMISEDKTDTIYVVVPAELEVGDIVYVGVCDRDISNALNGVISEATSRHHDINDGVILRVLR